MMARSRLVFQMSLIALLGVAVFGSTLAITQRDYRFFDPIIEAHGILTQTYVTAPDEEAMQRAAITALVESLDDPYTVFVPPADRREFDKDLTGQYVGIGALVQGSAENWLRIVSPLEDSPASAAGLMAEDLIVEIEGVSTFGKSAEECVEFLVGEPGTTVSLVIDRDGERMNVDVERQRIVTRTVRGFHRRDDDRDEWHYMIDEDRAIAYARISQFNATTVDEFQAMLDEVGAENDTLGGLIIDVRGNPGGLLNAATRIADMFIDEGVIVSTDGRAHRRDETLATSQGTLPEFPVVVLINGQAASASEVLAGALVEQDHAIAVGTRSFGKGSVQSVRPLPSLPGAQIKVTEQRYYLPSGRSIHREPGSSTWGVDPSDGYHVPMTREEMIAMMRARQDEEIIRDVTDDASVWSSPELVAEHLKDPQLGAAIKAIQIRLDTGTWESTGEALPDDDDYAAEALADARRARNRLMRELARIDRHMEETLEGIDGAEARAEQDFWPNDVDLIGGAVTIVDADGNEITTLEITGPNLERWLMDADVKAVEGDE